MEILVVTYHRLEEERRPQKHMGAENDVLLKNIIRSIKESFCRMDAFNSNRIEVLTKTMEYISSLDKIFMNSVLVYDVNACDRFITRIKISIKGILRGLTLSTEGSGAPKQDSVEELVAIALVYNEIFNLLRHLITHGNLEGVVYNYDSKTLKIEIPNEQNKYLEALNYLSLKMDENNKTNEFLKESMSLYGLHSSTKKSIKTFYEDKDVIAISQLPNEIIYGLQMIIKPYQIYEKCYFMIEDDMNLNGRYTYGNFKSVAYAFFMYSIVLRTVKGNNWFVYKTDLVDLINDINNLLEIEKEVIKTIIDDMIFKFDNEDYVEFQPLIIGEKGEALLIPLYVEDRLCNKWYIDISKSLYVDFFNGAQKALTSSFETAVEDVLKDKLKTSNVQAFKINNITQIDRVVSFPEDSIIILVQIKHHTTYSNQHIRKGISQLEESAKAVKNHWEQFSKKLKGWHGKSEPKIIIKLLVTNWFRGTLDSIPGDIWILNIDELKNLGCDDVDDFLRMMMSYNKRIRQDDIIYIFEERTLFDYTFIDETVELKTLDTYR